MVVLRQQIEVAVAGLLAAAALDEAPMTTAEGLKRMLIVSRLSI